MGTLLLISLGCTLATSLIFVPALLGGGIFSRGGGGRVGWLRAAHPTEENGL
jgi:hypothetical protein